MNRGPCFVDGCGSPGWSKGLCRFHYDRKRFGRPLDAKPRTKRPDTLRAIADALASDTTECVIWPFERNQQGYAKWANPDGRNHNVANHIRGVVNGPPPTPRHETAHSCGKGHEGCINPRHLSWKTCLDNMHDKYEHGTHLMGGDSPLSVLTEADVRAIHAAAAAGGHQQTIADQYGISRSHVASIRGGYRWGHLKLNG